MLVKPLDIKTHILPKQDMGFRFTYILHKLFKVYMVFSFRKIYNIYCQIKNTFRKGDIYDNVFF